eukprot:6003410-Pyramimonas_sp.AAC.1
MCPRFQSHKEPTEFTPRNRLLRARQRSQHRGPSSARFKAGQHRDGDADSQKHEPFDIVAPSASSNTTVG